MRNPINYDPRASSRGCLYIVVASTIAVVIAILSLWLIDRFVAHAN